LSAFADNSQQLVKSQDAAADADGMVRGRRCATVVALWAVVAAGCDDGSGKDSAAPAITTEVPTTVVTTTVVTPTTAIDRTTVMTKPAPTPTPAADRATAQRIVLTAADVPTLPSAKPSGYTEIYAQCGKNPLLPGGTDPRQAVPSAFLKDETAEVRRLQTTALGGYAALATTEAAARSTMGTVRSPAFRACLERELAAAVNAVVAGGIPVQGAATVELPTPAMGDEVVAFRTTLTRGTSHQAFELTMVRKGRALASVVTSRLGDVPFPDDERVRLARVMTGRMP
jgi:hypothetical protein